MSEAAGTSHAIRDFRYPQDYSDVISLWQSIGLGVHVGRSDSAEEIEKKLRRDPDLFLVAESDGRIIGTVMGGFDGRRGMIYHLAVVRDQRQLGLGTALMDEVERRLKEKGCLRSYLMVTRDNPGVLDFYSRRGWETMDIHIMVKDL